MISRSKRENQQADKESDVSKIKKKRYLIQNTNNFQCYGGFKLLASEPLKYFAAHGVMICSMIYFYVLTFVTGLIVIEMNYAIIVFHILTFIFFVILGFKSPGITLKINEDFESKTKLNIPFDRDGKPAINEMAKSYAFPIKSHFIGLKFCSECLIYKPPRTVHCWICNACITKMDHHCPFIGNCVGKGNYQMFFCFVSTLACMILLIIIQLIILMVRLFQNNHVDAFKKPQLYFTILLIIFALFLMVFVGALWIFHVYLIINNVTTNELCKETWNTISGNPFKKNFCLKNIFWFIGGLSNRSGHNSQQQLQKSMVLRFKDKSQECLSSYSSCQPPISALEMKQLDAQKLQQRQKQQFQNSQQYQATSKSKNHQV